MTGTIPTELGNLTNLTYLNLGGNELEGDIPSELQNLTNLTVVVQRFCQFKWKATLSV